MKVFTVNYFEFVYKFLVMQINLPSVAPACCIHIHVSVRVYSKHQEKLRIYLEKFSRLSTSIPFRSWIVILRAVECFMRLIFAGIQEEISKNLWATSNKVYYDMQIFAKNSSDKYRILNPLLTFLHSHKVIIIVNISINFVHLPYSSEMLPIEYLDVSYFIAICVCNQAKWAVVT